MIGSNAGAAATNASPFSLLFVVFHSFVRPRHRHSSAPTADRPCRRAQALSRTAAAPIPEQIPLSRPRLDSAEHRGRSYSAGRKTLSVFRAVFRVRRATPLLAHRSLRGPDFAHRRAAGAARPGSLARYRGLDSMAARCHVGRLDRFQSRRSYVQCKALVAEKDDILAARACSCSLAQKPFLIL